MARRCLAVEKRLVSWHFRCHVVYVLNLQRIRALVGRSTHRSKRFNRMTENEHEYIIRWSITIAAGFILLLWRLAIDVYLRRQSRKRER